MAMTEFKQHVIQYLKKLSGISDNKIKTIFKTHSITEDYLYGISPEMSAKMILRRISTEK